MKQTIEIPKGFELVKVSDTEYKIQEKVRVLPKTWKEFCEISPITRDEGFVSSHSNIIASPCRSRDPQADANMLPSKDVAEAILALCQLIQLRDYYNDGWKPDWDNALFDKHYIWFNRDNIITGTLSFYHNILVFKTEELRDEFLENFRDLILKLKPLYE